MAHPLNVAPYTGFKPSTTPLYDEAWRDACRLSRFDCTGLPAPAVRFSEYAEALGVWGLYTGGNTVYMAPSLPLEKRKSQSYLVLVHEMVHYIETRLNQGGNGRVAVCLSEEEAFQVDGKLAHELGIGELDRSKTWRENYPACQTDGPWQVDAPEDDGVS